MKDTKQVLEDIADRFEPATDGFARCLRLHQERRERRQRVVALTLLALLVAAASIAGIEASRASAAKFPTALHLSKAAATQPTTPPPPLCAANAHVTSFTPTLSSSSGSPGSTVTVSGPLPVLDESGQLIGQTSNEVIAYWNLDLNHWTTALTSPMSPAAAVAGSAVELLGTQDVAGVCHYSFEVKIPTGAAPGTYPIQLLGESSDATGVGTAPFPPVNYQVTAP
jgi:hypothetical protein